MHPLPKIMPAMLLATAVASASANVTGETAPPSKPVPDFNSCAKPTWPRASLRNEETGTVHLAFLIDVDGKVVDTKIDSTSGFPLLDNAARDAIARCSFKPALVGGKPEKAWMKMAYIWSIESAPISTAAWQDAKTRAASGDARGEYDLAQLYLNGPSPAKDRPEAQRLLELAAAKNLPDAQYALATMLAPQRKDDGRVLSLLTSAAEQGKTDAQDLLGYLLVHGYMGHKDIDRGIAMLRKAHAGGHRDSFVHLGAILIKRAATAQESAEGIALLQTGAERLVAPALYELGRAYEMGTGVDKDFAQAAANYEKAVQRNSKPAMRALAGLYERGQGVAADAAMAQQLRAAAGAR